VCKTVKLHLWFDVSFACKISSTVFGFRCLRTNVYRSVQLSISDETRQKAEEQLSKKVAEIQSMQTMFASATSSASEQVASMKRLQVLPCSFNFRMFTIHFVDDSSAIGSYRCGWVGSSGRKPAIGAYIFAPDCVR
jgi:hypothetical protein